MRNIAGTLVAVIGQIGLMAAASADAAQPPEPPIPHAPHILTLSPDNSTDKPGMIGGAQHSSADHADGRMDNVLPLSISAASSSVPSRAAGLRNGPSRLYGDAMKDG